MNNPEDNHIKQPQFLSEIESKELLMQAGIAVTWPVLVCSPVEAAAVAREAGFPVVLKIVSPDIIHKSDCGGVMTGLTGPEAVEQAYNTIMTNVRRHYPQAEIKGISVQPQAEPGTEVIIGVNRDPQFGPAVMFGLGGIWVELLTDVSIRIAPLLREDASEMIRSLKGYRLLQGYRGYPKVDTDTLEDWLLKISDLAINTPSLKELDINPVFAYPSGAIAVDARILLE